MFCGVEIWGVVGQAIETLVETRKLYGHWVALRITRQTGDWAGTECHKPTRANPPQDQILQMSCSWYHWVWDATAWTTGPIGPGHLHCSPPSSRALLHRLLLLEKFFTLVLFLCITSPRSKTPEYVCPVVMWCLVPVPCWWMDLPLPRLISEWRILQIQESGAGPRQRNSIKCQLQAELVKQLFMGWNGPEAAS